MKFAVFQFLMFAFDVVLELCGFKERMRRGLVRFANFVFISPFTQKSSALSSCRARRLASALIINV